MLQPETISYFAGLFDGEGCVQITTRTDGNHQLLIMLANTNKTVIDILKENFGGYVCKMHSKNAKHKDYYTWRLTCLQARDFLSQVFPYLIIKKEQARIGIAFQSLMRPKGRTPISDSLFVQRDEKRVQLRKLNKKGK